MHTTQNLENRVESMDDVRIAIEQPTTVTGDVKGNTRCILDGIRRAKADSADLVVFPELAITGYMLGDLPEECMFLHTQRLALDHIAAQTEGIAVYVGFIDYDET